MSLAGKIVNGCQNVVAGGVPIARQTDLTDHGACIGEGCTTVIAGGAAMIVARMRDRFLCSSSVGGKPHVGGHIMFGLSSVLVGGRPIARQHDPTFCLADGAGPGFGDGLGGAGGGLSDAATAAVCQALWAQYDKEARDMIAPVDDDHRERNRVITGAYADLYLKDNGFAWAGLAGYASKQVGCAMDHAQNMAGKGDHPFAGQPGVKQAAEYTYDMLGTGNRELFLDIYPMHRFFQEHGWERLKQCAGERKPPVPAAALDGFAALDRYKRTGDKKDLVEHVRAIAFHEQVQVLQREIYNDSVMRPILDANEMATRDLGASPADVIMTDACSDPTGDKTFKFARGDRKNLYDVDQRMDWIINDIGGYYFDNIGGREHRDHLDRLRSEGKAAGGGYP